MKKITLGVIAALLILGTSDALAQGNSQARFNRSLQKGATGMDVTMLQEFLAQDSSVYPEGLVTGYYGNLTERAVMRFQMKNGIEQVGVVGPKTRMRLHAMLAMGSTTSTSTMGLPPGLAKKIVPGVSSTTLYLGMQGTQVTVCHTPPGNRLSRQTITVGGPALKAHLAHGDTMGSCDGTILQPPATTTSPSTTTPPTATTTPPQDTTAPIMSSLGASLITASSTSIVWVTNEPATSVIWYSTSTPVVLTASSTGFVSNSALSTGHSLDLVGLSPSTIYYYMVVSADASNNAATSTTAVFVTTP